MNHQNDSLLAHIETGIMRQFDIVSEVGLIHRQNQLHAVIYPNFKIVRELGILNLRDFMLLDVIEKYNQTAPVEQRVHTLSLVKDALPKTFCGHLRRDELSGFPCAPSPKNLREPDPTSQEYALIKQFIAELTQCDVCSSDYLEIDLALSSLEKVCVQAFIASTFGIHLTESAWLAHPTVAALADYLEHHPDKPARAFGATLKPADVSWSAILRNSANIRLPHNGLPHLIILGLTDIFVSAYFRLSVKGHDTLPDSQMILAANHQSFFDGFLISRFLRRKFLRKMYVFAGKKHFNSPFRRYIARTCNIIIVDIHHDLQRALRQMAAALECGGHLLIFPEGTRTKDGQLRALKKGFAILSREFRVPVVPIAIRGAFEAMPIGRVFPKFLRKIDVCFLPPISPERYSEDSLTEEVRQQILQILSEES